MPRVRSPLGMPRASDPRPSPPPDYAPYDTVEDPASLGLRAEAAYTEFGLLSFVRTARTGPQVTLFLHGVGGTWATWTPLVQAARDLGVDLGDFVLVDLPGFGASENLQPDLRVEDVGRALDGLIRQLGWEAMVVVGHSMGGFLALDMASRPLPSIRGVHIVSGAYFSVIDTVQAPLRSLVARPSTAALYLSMALLGRSEGVGRALIRGADAAGLMRLLLGRSIAYPDCLSQRLVTYISTTIAPRSFVLAARNGKGYDAARQWSQIAVPLRATFGREDPLVPAQDMARLQEAVPSAAVACVDQVSHFGHIERPGAVLRFLYEDRVSSD